MPKSKHLSKIVSESYDVLIINLDKTPLVNKIAKSLTFGYAAAVTVASAGDAIRATNTPARCFFAAGCACAAVGMVSTTIGVQFPAFAIASTVVGEKLVRLGQKANEVGQAIDM